MDTTLLSVQQCTIAYGRSSSSVAAVTQCANQLRTINPLMLIVFVGGKHERSVVVGAFHKKFPGVPIVGGSSAGAIVQGASGYSGLEIGVLAITDPRIVPKIVVNHDLLVSEHAAGFALGQELRTAAPDDGLVLLFFDSVATSSPLRLHPASAIVDGLYAGLGGKHVTLVGGGLLTDLNLGDAWVFDGFEARKHTAIALAFPPGVVATVEIMHGCRPVSAFMRITEMQGSVVHEIDHRPALAVLEEMLGLRLAGKTVNDLTLIATLGAKQGDLYAPFTENAYVNRLILGGDREGGTVTLFEPDFEAGTQVQIMARDNELMLQSVRDGVERVNKSLSNSDVLFALYVDCAGRASAVTGATVEEADLLRRSLTPTIPFVGFYSGVEVAPFHGRPRALDWTGVLAVVQCVL